MKIAEMTVFRVSRLCHKSILIFVFAGLYLTSNPSFAQYFTGAVAMGAGGAGRAAAEQSESILMNPAALAHARDFSGGFFVRHGFFNGNEEQHLWGFTLVDHTAGNYIPGSVSYIQRKRQLKSEMTTMKERYYNVTVGRFIYEQWAWGLSLVHLSTDENGKTYLQWNGVLGLHWTPFPDLGLALVQYHFVRPSPRVPDYARLLPKLSFAVTYLFNDFFRARLDVSEVQAQNPQHQLDWQGGLESYVSHFFILRAGYGNDQRLRQHYLSVGLTFNGPRFKLDYSFHQQQGDGYEALHSVDMRVPF